MAESISVTRPAIAAALLIVFVLASEHGICAEPKISNEMAVSAPIDTNSSARGGDIAIKSVFQLLCFDTNSQGTGFLHKSGKLITAAHVVKDCESPIIKFLDGGSGSSRVIASDADLDIAILEPTFSIDADALPISKKDDLKIGAQVSKWGFPSGYNGLNPMLSVGYLAGIQAVKPADNKIEKQWVVNAAFNRGNSGGPLLEIETGEVIGVVSSKIVPLSQDAKGALTALQNQHYGFTYEESSPDKTKRKLSEGQVVAMVLEELGKQVQLVIGNAVRGEDIRAFLRANKIDP